MTGYAVEDAALNLVSLGTRVANPLPAGLTAVVLSDADYTGLLSGAKLWQNGAAVDNPAYVAAQQQDANGVQLNADLRTLIPQLRTIANNASNAAALRTVAGAVLKLARVVANQLDGTS